ncbi:MAG: RebB family R body protein, partial [Brevundimonas sp.]|nr:RebB family R body protein [Brevundimonas sp.]
SRITDAVTQQNMMVLGSASTVAMGSIYQSAAHSTAIVFQNAVQAQRQASICAQAATNQGVMQVYEMGGLVSAAATARVAARPPASNTLETAVMLLVALKMLKL